MAEEKEDKSPVFKYFINNLDSPLGVALHKRLYNPEEPDVKNMCCTYLDNSRRDKLPGVGKVIRREKPKLYRRYLVKSEICIFDLLFGDINELEFAVKAFKEKGPHTEPRTIILVSSVLVWDGTPRKIKPPPEEEKKEDAQDEAPPVIEEKPKKTDDDEDEDSDEDEKKPVEIPVEVPVIEEQPGQEDEIVEYLPFKEEDYKLRSPREQYENLKRLEDLLLEMNMENVKVYVVCAGILYGCGEIAFKNHIKAAWLQNPAELPFIGDGENLVPTIHIDDLARFVTTLPEKAPENPYHFAIDNTKNRKQSNIIQSIASQIGTGIIHSIGEADDKIIKKEFQDMFTVNVDMVPSPLLVTYTEEGEAQIDPDWGWVAPNGIPGSIPTILKEFCQREHLKPIKIMTKGKPKSNKSHFSAMLAKHYNIPHIKVKELLLNASNMEGELGEHFNIEKDKIWEYFRERKERPLDESLKVFYRLIRWRLSQNDCKNRGFVLDDFPNHLDEFNYVFIKKLERKLKRKEPKKKKKKQAQGEDGQEPVDGEEKPADSSQIQEPVEGGEPQGDEVEPEEEPEEQPPEDEGEEEEGVSPYEDYFPDSIIYFKPHPKPIEDSDDDVYRVEVFNQYEKTTKLFNFFADSNIDLYMFDPSNKTDDFECLQSLRVYIEKDGRPNNYLDTEEHLASKNRDYYKHKHEVNVKRLEQDKAKQEQLLDKERQRRLKIVDQEMDYLLHHEIPDPEEKNKPFRNYMMEYITPLLGEGLLHISDIMPDDPVDYLAEYLFKRSFEQHHQNKK